MRIPEVGDVFPCLQVWNSLFVCFVMLLHLLLSLLHTIVVLSGQPYGLSPDKIHLPAAQDRALPAAVAAAGYIRPRETDCRNFNGGMLKVGRWRVSRPVAWVLA